MVNCYIRAHVHIQARNKGKDLLEADKGGTTEGLLLQSLPERDEPLPFLFPPHKAKQAPQSLQQRPGSRSTPHIK